METLDELKSIRDNAVNGATHIGADMEYIKWVETEGLYFNYGNKHSAWHIMEIQDIEVMRSLSDINRIIELMEATKGLLQIFGGTPGGYWRNELNAARKALGYKI